MNKIILVLSAIAGIFILNGCKKEFAELNQDPSAVVEATPSFMMAGAIREFETSGYQFWFYNAKYFAKSTQLFVSDKYTVKSAQMGATGRQGTQYLEMLKYRNNILQRVESENTKNNCSYLSVCNVLSIFCGLFDSDVFGSIPYDEACMYQYGGTLTPAYDRVEDLYNEWLATLDECVANFQDATQEFVSSQDAIYHGDRAKWAKLANSLKLKIAVRLLNNDKAKAMSIRDDVLSSSAGYIDNIGDDFLYNKADVITSGDGDYVYHFGDEIWAYELNATTNVVNFLLANKDPRVRFIYKKNDFNSKIVQGFIKEGRYDDLPEAVKNNVVLENGSFKAWGGMGEPWVRYIGMPVVWDASEEYEACKDEFFEQTSIRYSLGGKQFNNVSTINEEMIRGRVDYTVPTLSTDDVIQDKDDNPWWGLYLGAGEVNLYLAELAAIDGKSYADFYEKGVKASVQEYDKLAGLNKIPYYDKTYDYDPNEATVELKDGEIEAMLKTEGIALSGSLQKDLEKIYLQQLIHFSLQPDEQFVTARRSGYPKFNSELLPRVDFKGFAAKGFLRRFEVSQPLETDLMRDIKIAAYEEQGITPGSNQSGLSDETVLNSERLWMDQKAPQWGAGSSN